MKWSNSVTVPDKYGLIKYERIPPGQGFVPTYQLRLTHFHDLMKCADA